MSLSLTYIHTLMQTHSENLNQISVNEIPQIKRENGQLFVVMTSIAFQAICTCNLIGQTLAKSYPDVYRCTTTVLIDDDGMQNKTWARYWWSSWKIIEFMEHNMKCMWMWMKCVRHWFVKCIVACKPNITWRSHTYGCCNALTLYAKPQPRNQNDSVE